MHLILSDAVHRLSTQRAICKQCGIFLGVSILLVGAVGRLGGVNLIWAAGPLVLLGLADAGYAAEQRRCAELLGLRKGREETPVLPSATAGASIRATVLAVLSLSIWPFYLGLLGAVAAGAFLMPIKETPTPVVPAAVAGPMASAPGQFRRPATPWPVPPQYMQQRPPGIPPGFTPFPVRPPLSPAIPRNGSPGVQPPSTPIPRFGIPGNPPPLGATPSSPPVISTPAAKNP